MYVKKGGNNNKNTNALPDNYGQSGAPSWYYFILFLFYFYFYLFCGYYNGNQFSHFFFFLI